MGDYFLGLLSGLCFGFVVLICVDGGWCKACVRHGAAEYNQTTGAWQWKGEETR